MRRRNDNAGREEKVHPIYKENHFFEQGLSKSDSNIHFVSTIEWVGRLFLDNREWKKSEREEANAGDDDDCDGDELEEEDDEEQQEVDGDDDGEEEGLDGDEDCSEEEEEEEEDERAEEEEEDDGEEEEEDASCKIASAVWVKLLTSRFCFCLATRRDKGERKVNSLARRRGGGGFGEGMRSKGTEAVSGAGRSGGRRGEMGG